MVVDASVVVVDEVVEMLPGVTGAGAGGTQIAAGCGGSDVVAGGGALETVDVVATDVEVVIRATVIGTIRSGILPSVPSVESANNVSASTPASANTTPLEIAMIVDR